jgi:hypothetical protein
MQIYEYFSNQVNAVQLILACIVQYLFTVVVCLPQAGLPFLRRHSGCFAASVTVLGHCAV